MTIFHGKSFFFSPHFVESRIHIYQPFSITFYDFFPQDFVKLERKPYGWLVCGIGV